MLKAVLDSSVLVSALLTPSGPSGRILDALEAGAFELCLSREIVAETRNVLLRPTGWIQRRLAYSEAHVEGFLGAVGSLATMAEELPALSGVALAAKDDMVVATAVATRADVLVTGDRRHLLPLGTHDGIRIVTPRAFLEML